MSRCLPACGCASLHSMWIVDTFLFSFLICRKISIFVLLFWIKVLYSVALYLACFPRTKRRFLGVLYWCVFTQQ